MIGNFGHQLGSPACALFPLEQVRNQPKEVEKHHIKNADRFQDMCTTLPIQTKYGGRLAVIKLSLGSSLRTRKFELNLELVAPYLSTMRTCQFSMAQYVAILLPLDKLLDKILDIEIFQISRYALTARSSCSAGLPTEFSWWARPCAETTQQEVIPKSANLVYNQTLLQPGHTSNAIKMTSSSLYYGTVCEWILPI